MNLNLQTLIYFVSLARTKSYTKAAKECFVSQPALSRSISEFERQLGCHLVNRNNRSMGLTEEGEICLIEAKKILKQCNLLQEKITNSHQQFKYPVKIGYIIYGQLATFNKRISEITNSNLVKIETEYDSLVHILERFQTGEIDVVILPEKCIIMDSEIKIFPLLKSKLYILVPSKHSFFHRKFVHFQDLNNQKFVGWDPEEVPLLSEAHSKACQDHGFKPDFVTYGRKMGDIMTLAILHNSLGFTASNSTIVDSKEFKLIPIIDSEEKFGTALICKKENKNPSVKKLINILKK